MDLNEEEIYFGNNCCFLYPCSGFFRSYKKEYIQQDEINEKSILEALKYADDLSYIKSEYKDHYIPAIPEIQIHYINNNLKEDEKENIDFFLNQPLIKTKEIKNYSNYYKCVTSGHRSALIKDDKTGYYYRLKGCGNEELGFNLKKASGNFTQYNTRGSQYDYTCFRELFFSEKINKILKKINMKCANVPIGFWKYDKNLNILPDEKNKNEEIPKLENKIPEIDKYCGIFRTFGERRLRTHLLLGFDIILESIAKLCISKNSINEENLNEIKKIFPESRLPDRIKTYIVVLNFKYDSIVSCNKLKKEIKENENLKTFLENSERYDELYPILSEGLSEKNKKLLRKILDKLIEEQKNGKKFFENLINIYARIGYETGKVKKCLKENNINWGTYIDREIDFHCNAHANNFVILPQGNDSLLAPLDFDLAYSKEKMVILSKSTDSFGKHDNSFFENYIEAEFTYLAQNLCGAEDYNYQSERKRFRQDTFEAKIRNVFKFLLCDCLLENYMKVFDNFSSNDIINNNKLKEDNFFHNIIKLALILTSNDIA